MRRHLLSPTNHHFEPAHLARVLRFRLFQATDELKDLDDEVVFAGQSANGVRCHPSYRLRSKRRRLNVFCSQPFLWNVSYADSWLTTARAFLDHTSILHCLFRFDDDDFLGSSPSSASFATPSFVFRTFLRGSHFMLILESPLAPRKVIHMVMILPFHAVGGLIALSLLVEGNGKRPRRDSFVCLSPRLGPRPSGCKTISA